MNKQKEALRLALEALEHEAEIGNDDAYRTERDAIREALAEQDDPGLQDKDPELVEQHYKQVVDDVRKVFDAKRETLPAQDQGQSCYCPNCEALSKELAALKAQQQPVAQCTASDVWNCKYCLKNKTCAALNDPRNFAPPQPAQPSKPWVGLVKEDWPLSPVCWTEDYKAGVAWAETKLREKNA